MTTYTTLRAANIARQREWDSNNQKSLLFRGVELAGEVGEACNIIKKLERERLGINGSRSTKEELAKELADGHICIDLIAMHTDIDMERAVADKFNETSEARGLSTRFVPVQRDKFTVFAAHEAFLDLMSGAELLELEGECVNLKVRQSQLRALMEAVGIDHPDMNVVEAFEAEVMDHDGETT